MMKKFALLTFVLPLCCLFSFQSYAGSDVQYTVHDIKGNPFKSVRFLPEGAGDRANALHIDGDRLYYGAGSTLYVYDISNPGTPMLSGSIRLEGLCRQITSKDGIAYVASRESGVWVVDAKNPSAMSVLTRYDAVELATGLDICGDVLFISLRIYGVEFVDISTPSSPQHIYLQKTSESQSCWYQDGILYSGDWGRREITAISASDMSDIKVLYKHPLRGNGDGLVVQGKYLYAATGHHSNDPALTKEENFGNGHAVEIFDISNPLNPVCLSRTHFDKLYTRGNDYWSVRPTGDGRYAFMSDTFNGLHAIDIRRPQSPGIVGRITFSKRNKDLAMSALEIGRGYIYAAVYGGGLAVIECPVAKPMVVNKGKAPVNVSYRYAYPVSESDRFINWRPEERAQVRSVAACGDVLYAACSSAGLAILKREPDGNVRRIGSGPCNFAGDVKIRGGKLYVAEGMDGLGIYEIGDGAELKEEARFNDFGNGLSLCLWVEVPNDDYIVVSPREGGYIYLDVRNFPDYKVTVRKGGCPGWNRYVPNWECKGGLFPMALLHQGLCWVDLSGDTPKVSPKDVGLRVNQTGGITNYKNGSAATIIKGKLMVIPSGAGSDKAIAAGNVPMSVAAPLWDGGNLLAATNGGEKFISLLDVTDESNLRELWREKTTGLPERPVFHNGKLIVPCGYEGLLIQK